MPEELPEITPDQEYLIDRYKYWQDQGKEEWFQALCYAAMDTAKSMRQAIDMADEACKDTPMPDSLKKDIENKSIELLRNKAALVKKKMVDYAGKGWEEEKHPRGQPDNAGQFTETEGGGKGEGKLEKKEEGKSKESNSKGTDEWLKDSKIKGVVYTGQKKGLEEIPETDRNELPFGYAFFTTDESVASQYAGTHSTETSGQHDYSTGRKGEVYAVKLNIKNPMDLDKFDEDEWARHLLPEKDIDTDGYSNKDLAEVLELEVEYDDDGKKIGYLTPNGEPLDRNFSLDDAAKLLWNERSGSGDTLEYALANSPSGQLSVMFPDAGKRYVEANNYDGYIFEDAEMGGTTIIPFSEDQIYIDKSKGN